MSLAEYNWRITGKRPDEAWDLGEYKVVNENSGGGTFAPGSSQATVQYLVEYFYVENFLDTVLGKTVKVGSSLKRSAASPSFGGTEGSTPEEHPYWYNFFAASADVRPVGRPAQDGDFALWDKALVTVAFRPNNYNVIPDGGVAAEHLRFTSKVPEGQADFQTSLGFFKFVGDPDHRQLENTPGQTVPALRTTYTWKQIPVARRSDGHPDLGRVPNIGTILPLMGSVNEVAFDGYPPGSVLFVTWTSTLIQPQVATADNYYWDIGYVFGVRDYGTSPTPYVAGEHAGWNYAFDPLRDVWDLYTTDGTVAGKTMYPYRDLNALFEVNW